MRVLILPYSWQHLVFTFFNFSHFREYSGYVILAFFFSLMTNNVEHIFMCLSCYPYVEMPIQNMSIFYFDYFSSYWILRVFHIWWIQILHQVNSRHINIFKVYCLEFSGFSNFLLLSFLREILYCLGKFPLSFFLIEYAFDVIISQISLYNWSLQRFSHVFYTFSAYIYVICYVLMFVIGELRM